MNLYLVDKEKNKAVFFLVPVTLIPALKFNLQEAEG